MVNANAVVVLIGRRVWKLFCLVEDKWPTWGLGDRRKPCSTGENVQHCQTFCIFTGYSVPKIVITLSTPSLTCQRLHKLEYVSRYYSGNHHNVASCSTFLLIQHKLISRTNLSALTFSMLKGATKL